MAEERLDIHDVTAKVLRVGVVSSVAVMLLGLAVTLLRDRPGIYAMETQRFSADFPRILAGAGRGDGLALLELGVALLVLTPIVRVAASWAIFARQRDWLYAVITGAVLALTLVSLLFLK